MAAPDLLQRWGQKRVDRPVGFAGLPSAPLLTSLKERYQKFYGNSRKRELCRLRTGLAHVNAGSPGTRWEKIYFSKKKSAKLKHI